MSAPTFFNQGNFNQPLNEGFKIYLGWPTFFPRGLFCFKTSSWVKKTSLMQDNYDQQKQNDTKKFCKFS